MKFIKDQMLGKSVLVTGGSAGIGKATCKGLARMGAKVIIHARNQIRGEAARREVIQDTGVHGIDLLIADLSAKREVKTLINKINDKYECIDVLINNAGVFYTDYKESEDGIELQWATNHLAPFMLTNGILDKLKAAPQGRIINVSSHSHRTGTINFENINHKNIYKGLEAYAQSKLANILFTKELARRLDHTNVITHAVHPGLVKTEIGQKHSTSWIGIIWKIGRPLMSSEAKGAETSIFLASDTKVAQLNGQYYEKCKLSKSSLMSYDADLAERLWNFSLDMTR